MLQTKIPKHATILRTSFSPENFGFTIKAIPNMQIKELKNLLPEIGCLVMINVINWLQTAVVEFITMASDIVV